MNASENVGSGIVPVDTRWLAGSAACCAAIFGAVAFGAPFLLLGALVQPWARTTGRLAHVVRSHNLVPLLVMGPAFVF